MQTFQNVTFLKIMEDSAGQRLDNFLFKTLKGVPKSRIYRLIRRNEIRVNRSRASASTKLYLSDEVRLPPIRLSARENKYVDPLFKPETQIVFENSDLIVFNKPTIGDTKKHYNTNGFSTFLLSKTSKLLNF